MNLHTARVGGAKASLQVHGCAQSFDLEVWKISRQQALQQRNKTSTGCISLRREAPLLRLQLERLRLSLAHAQDMQAKSSFAHRDVDDAANYIAFF